MHLSEMSPRQQEAIHRLEKMETALFSMANDYDAQATTMGTDSWLNGFYQGKRDAFRLAAKHLHEALVEL